MRKEGAERGWRRDGKEGEEGEEGEDEDEEEGG